MITWKNDQLLIDVEPVEPKNFITANDLIKNRKEALLFLDKNKRILNLYSALVKKLDFIGSEGSHILDRMPYVRCGNLKEFISKLPTFYKKDNYFPLRKLIGKYLGLKRKISHYQFHYWINNIIPLPVLRVMAWCYSPNNLNRQCKFLAKIFQNNFQITNSHSKGCFVPLIKLHQLFTSKYFYFIGFVAGDGHLCQGKVLTLYDGTSHREELHYSYEFLRRIKIFLKKEFYLNSSLKSNKNLWSLIISNKWFCRFMNFFFDIKFGRKYELNVPAIFSLSSKKNRLIYSFWRGLFDAEGSIRSSNLSLSSKSLVLLQDCKENLGKIGITGNIYPLERGFSFYIYVSDFLKFAKYIGFFHPRKQKNFVGCLLSGCKETTFVGLDHKKMVGKYFDLAIIPLRIYGASKFFLKLRKELGISQREVARLLKVGHSTVAGWEKEVSGIPIQKILFLNFRLGYDKLNFYSELKNYEIEYGIGRRKSKRIKLPLEVSEDLLSIASCIRQSSPKLHIYSGFRRKTVDMGHVLMKIRKLFNVRVRIQKNGAYRIDSKSLAEFFKNFFIYKPIWKALTQNQAKVLEKSWDCLGV